MKRKFYVRIDSRATSKEMNEDVFKAHLEYVENLKKDNFLMAGGFEKEGGGLLIFQTDNYKKAKEICDNDPVIKEKYFDYKLYKWDIQYISKVKEVLLSD